METKTVTQTIKTSTIVNLFGLLFLVLALFSSSTMAMEQASAATPFVFTSSITTVSGGIGDLP